MFSVRMTKHAIPALALAALALAACSEPPQAAIDAAGAQLAEAEAAQAATYAPDQLAQATGSTWATAT